MSGHSKWATIKRKKAATDAKRGKAFTRLLKEVQVAAKLGGSNIEGNPRLKSAVTTAKAMSVPMDNIERAINRGTGDLDGVDYEEVLYEGYGPGGVAILVKALSDNRNRTASDVRNAFAKGGGSLAGANAVAHIFQERGVLTIAKSEISEEKLIEGALEAGADDVRDEGDTFEVHSTVPNYGKVRGTLEALSIRLEGELRMVPSSVVAVSGTDADHLMKLLSLLDELDDVQEVVSNFELSYSEVERLGSGGLL